MRSYIKLIGPVTDADKSALTEFLGHDCMQEGEWSKFGRTDSTFEFAVCSNGKHCIRLPGYSINGIFYKMKEVKTSIDAYGYVLVSGWATMAGLVARAFLPNFEPYPIKEVNHLDGNKLNNDVSNLEMVTHKENTDHFFHDERMIEKRETWRDHHRGTNHWTEESVRKIREKLTGRHHTAETKEKIAAAHRGKKLSFDHVEAIKRANKGNKHCLGKICITNGFENKIIDPEDFVDELKNQGFRRGKTIFNPPKPGTKSPYKHSPEFLEKQRLRKLSKEVVK